MELYIQAYKNVLKRNVYLFLIIVVLLVLTFGIWVGIPFFVLSIWIFDFTSSGLLSHFGMIFSIGCLFSIYFVPINLKVAKNIFDVTGKSLISSFLKIEISFIIIIFLIFESIFLVIISLN